MHLFVIWVLSPNRFLLFEILVLILWSQSPFQFFVFLRILGLDEYALTARKSINLFPLWNLKVIATNHSISLFIFVTSHNPISIYHSQFFHHLSSFKAHQDLPIIHPLFSNLLSINWFHFAILLWNSHTPRFVFEFKFEVEWWQSHTR